MAYMRNNMEFMFFNLLFILVNVVTLCYSLSPAPLPPSLSLSLSLSGHIFADNAIFLLLSDLFIFKFFDLQ
jgi:hypothetical protein